MKRIDTDQAPAAIGPYSQGMEVNGLLFLSGQIPLRADGGLVEGGIEAQTHQVLQNIGAILSAEGLSPEHVVKTTVFLTNFADFATMNSLYAAFFGEHRPARSTVQVAKLPRDVCVEIEVVATRSR